jgi:hypothetical protein
MPEEVEERLDIRIRNFLWADKSQATVNRETVHAPSGGKKLNALFTQVAPKTVSQHVTR